MLKQVQHDKDDKRMMTLKNISLQNFRSYQKSQFTFSDNTSLIVGPNTAGKSNLIEAIYLLSFGKSFRSEKDSDMISFDKEIGRVNGSASDTELEVVLTKAPLKKFLVNGVAKRRLDFAGILSCVLFSPLDLEIIIGSPSNRRNLLNDVLEQADQEYKRSHIDYTKALRQRNALLEKTRETGERNEKLFEYWDSLLIENGAVLTKKREEFIEFANSSQKDICDFVMYYDKSIISKARLLQYQEAEVGAGNTLVGPHRDDFFISLFNNTRLTTHNVKTFGSRGQQRLAILQLKLLQLSFIEKAIGERPVLLLDDIFSELDEGHIELVLEMVDKQQTIMTTTHKEFFKKTFLQAVNVIELG